MTDNYKDLRDALDAFKPGNGDAMLAYRLASDPTTIRALLAERDKFFFALQEISHPEAVRGDATKIARAALAQEQGDKE